VDGVETAAVATVVEDRTRAAVGSDRLLLGAAAVFALAVVLHNGDHVRRGTDAVDADVFWVGTAGIALEVAVVVLVCARHRLAPLAAAAAGVGLAAGYVVVHFLPERSWLSDSFTGGADVSPLSWTAASLEVVAALALAAAGAVVLDRRGGLASASAPRADEVTLAEGLRHPLALGFALSQVAVVAVSVGQVAA
jgi:hypothetical protein